MATERMKQLAQAGTTAVEAFKSLPNNSESAATLQLLGCALMKFYKMGFDLRDMLAAGQAVHSAMEKELLGDR